MAWAVGEEETAVLLEAELGEERPFILKHLPITRTQGDPTTLKIAGKERKVVSTTVAWANKAETMWTDKHGAVLKIDDGKGRTAVAIRYLRYT